MSVRDFFRARYGHACFLVDGQVLDYDKYVDLRMSGPAFEEMSELYEEFLPDRFEDDRLR